jgi:hypothetical protein
MQNNNNGVMSQLCGETEELLCLTHQLILVLILGHKEPLIGMALHYHALIYNKHPPIGVRLFLFLA